MAEITIGEVHLISDGNTLTIAHRDQPNLTMSLDATGVEELIEQTIGLRPVGLQGCRRHGAPRRDHQKPPTSIYPGDPPALVTAAVVEHIVIPKRRRRK